ncbi:MAG TPA: transcription elongation factor GreA [Candidatus Paceibacterota bacterium]|nr:transcription elongation factor GreA [Candidatus Paceibacterota bacterium]
MNSKQYVTKERLEEFKLELEELKNKRRLEVAQRLKQAKEYGDLSENSEYAEAREEQANVETRIAELEELVKNASIIEKADHADSVQVGSTVIVKKGEKVSTYTIVGPYEAKPEDGRISDESPLGRAFLKRRVGESVNVATPAGSATYQIVEIK